MGMMRGDEYRESLKKVKPLVYYMGEQIDSVVDHPAFIPHVNSAALTYEMAWMPEFEELLTTKSHLTGEKINFFTHVHQSRQDLVRKVKALRALGQHTGSCFARCVGHDALNGQHGWVAMKHVNDGVTIGVVDHEQLVIVAIHALDDEAVEGERGCVRNPCWLVLGAAKT